MSKSVVTDPVARMRFRMVEVAQREGVTVAARQFGVSRPTVYKVLQRWATEGYDIPATVHVAIGTDVVNSHPAFDGAKAGAASQIDFKVFCHNVCRLKNGGVALNFGSEVIMPEIFLKAISIARNLDPKFSKFTTANFDMISSYLPANNIVRRPRLLGAVAYDFAGHHEIMLPLLWAALKDQLNLDHGKRT